jgi:hypothetical protein
LSVAKLVPDLSQWGGDHAQWKALWTNYFSANPISLARPRVSA